MRRSPTLLARQELSLEGGRRAAQGAPFADGVSRWSLGLTQGGWGRSLSELPSKQHAGRARGRCSRRGGHRAGGLGAQPTAGTGVGPGRGAGVSWRPPELQLRGVGVLSCGR